MAAKGSGQVWVDPIMQLLHGGDVVQSNVSGTSHGAGGPVEKTFQGVPYHDLGSSSISTGPLFDHYTGSAGGPLSQNKMRRCSPVAFGLSTLTTGNEDNTRLAECLRSTDHPLRQMLNVVEFGSSPFDLGMGHMESPDEVSFVCYEAVQQCGDEQLLGEVWFRHASPTLMEITGKKFKGWFNYKVDFSFMCMESATRCFNEKDRVMRLGWNQPVWRLLVSLQLWLNFSIIDHEQREPGYINTLLSTNDPVYSVARTRMLFCPVPLGGNWNLYSFDKRDRVLTVMDPKLTYCQDDEYHAKHDETIGIMFDGMTEAGVTLGDNNGWVMNRAQWTVKFNSGWHYPSSDEDSGAYMLFYAEYFDGDTLTRIVHHGDIIRRRKKLAYDVLRMSGNFGERPGFFYD